MRPAIVLAVLAAAVVGAAAVVFFALTDGPIVQPIAFKHKVHAEDLGMACTDCHLYALNGVRATIPNIQVCGDCHPEAITESPEEERLVEYVQAQQLIPWQKVYWVPDHVYFSHRRHAGAAGIECERCHGAVGETEEPVTSRLVPLSMDVCMGCHDESGTSNDCLLCHR